MQLSRGRSRFLPTLFALMIGAALLTTPQAFAQQLPRDYEVLSVGGQHFWISWASQELGTLLPPVVPVAVFGQEGELILKEVPVSDQSLAPLGSALLFGGACSGGQCAGGGTVLDCPSGGTNCGDDEVCACQCEQQSNGSYSAVHRCEELELAF